MERECVLCQNDAVILTATADYPPVPSPRSSFRPMVGLTCRIQLYSRSSLLTT